MGVTYPNVTLPFIVKSDILTFCHSNDSPVISWIDLVGNSPGIRRFLLFLDKVTMGVLD